MRFGRKHAAAAGVFVVATVTISAVGMVVTGENATAWRNVLRVSPASGQRTLRFSALSSWRDLRDPPPSGVQGLHGQGVTVVALLRPELDEGGAWLVGDTLSLRPGVNPPHWSKVWVPVPEEHHEAVRAADRHVVRAVGTFAVGAHEIAKDLVTAYTLELGELWVRTGGATDPAAHDHHDCGHDHHDH